MAKKLTLMNACKGYAAGRIWLQTKLGGGREGIVYRWAWGSGGSGGGGRWGRGGGFAEGQDVCLPMSHDSERKRSREWAERGVQGEKR